MAPGEHEAEILRRGATILEPTLLPHGFEYVPGNHGHGSGGDAAQATFIRDQQVLSLHFRHALGLVSYRWRDIDLTHREYLRGVGAKGAYPGFSDDPLDGFRHLQLDLAKPLQGWLIGSFEDFANAASIATTAQGSRFP